MTKEEIAKALEVIIRENAKRPPEDQIRDMIESGLIDEQGRVYSERMAMVEDLLRKKGFAKIIVSHSGRVAGVPGGCVRLREIHDAEPRAEGPYERISAIIGGARDKKDLWASLASAGYARKPRDKSRKKTG
jgi:hypothetical protein